MVSLEPWKEVPHLSLTLVCDFCRVPHSESSTVTIWKFLLIFKLEASSFHFTWVLEPVLWRVEGGGRSGEESEAWPALPLPSRYFCPDLSRAQMEQPASPRPVPASIVNVQRVKRTSCESIKCPGCLGKLRLCSLPPIKASLASLSAPAARRTQCLGWAPSPGCLTRGPELAPTPTLLKEEGLSRWARRSLPLPPSPAI